MIDSMRKRPRTALSLLCLGAAIALVLAACGGSSGSSASGSSQGGSKSSESAKTITIAGKQANDHGTKAVTGGSVDVEMDDNYFEPTVLTGKPGQTVTIHLENEGTAEHNFSISSQKISQNVQSGAEAEVKVKFPKSGILPFFCSFHTSLGMNGGLKVSG